MGWLRGRPARGLGAAVTGLPSRPVRTPVPPTPAPPRPVELGFADGSIVTLDPDSAGARTLQALLRRVTDR